MGSTMTVDTANVAGRRTLKLADPAALLAEIDRLLDAERAGRVRTLGNWSLAQILDHLAIAIEFSYSGAPFQPPLPIRLFGRIGKRVSYKGIVSLMLRPGFKLPAKARALEPQPDSNLERAAARLKAQVTRLRNGEASQHPNVLLGRLTLEQLIYLQLRHAELHLGFVVVD